MINAIKRTLGALCVVAGLGTPFSAWAQMPQTDVAFLNQMESKDVATQLKALTLYYDLHVSELDTQMKNELRTGAFFAEIRVKKKGDAMAIAKAEATLKKAGVTLSAAKDHNQKLRAQLLDVSGIGFADSLVMAPEAPDALPPISTDAPDSQRDERAATWAAYEAARTTWREARFALLAVQDRYNNGEKVSIGDAMRDMTRAEIALARAACDVRLNAAKVAAANNASLADALGGL